MSWTLLSPFVLTLALASPDYAMHEYLAAQGPAALANPAVQWQLGLSPYQRSEIAQIMEAQLVARSEMLMQPQSKDEFAAAYRQIEMTILEWKTEDQLLSVLDPAQLERASQAVSEFHVAKLRPAEIRESILFYDPVRTERMRHIA